MLIASAAGTSNVIQKAAVICRNTRVVHNPPVSMAKPAAVTRKNASQPESTFRVSTKRAQRNRNTQNKVRAAEPKCLILARQSPPRGNGCASNAANEPELNSRPKGVRPSPNIPTQKERMIHSEGSGKKAKFTRAAMSATSATLHAGRISRNSLRTSAFMAGASSGFATPRRFPPTTAIRSAVPRVFGP